MGVLKNQAHIYIDSQIRFFPGTKGRLNSDIPSARTIRITVYYDSDTNIPSIIDKIVDVLGELGKIFFLLLICLF